MYGGHFEMAQLVVASKLGLHPVTMGCQNKTILLKLVDT
jgi:hypothetical protein